MHYVSLWERAVLQLCFTVYFYNRRLLDCPWYCRYAVPKAFVYFIRLTMSPRNLSRPRVPGAGGRASPAGERAPAQPRARPRASRAGCFGQGLCSCSSTGLPCDVGSTEHEHGTHMLILAEVNVALWLYNYLYSPPVKAILVEQYTKLITNLIF